METVVITSTPRTELGKKATRALRTAGNIPCNIYGGKDTINFQAPASSFRKLIYTPEFKLAEIQLNGNSYKAIVKDIQFDPISDSIIHIDFQQLMDDVKVKVELPLKLKGIPKGAATGGKLEQVMRKLRVLALPKHLPNVIELEVSDMDMGSVKRVRDISYEGVTFLEAQANPVARMAIPRAAKEAAAADAKAAAAPAKK
jgi:large subunit ribosomal protein L25